MPDKSQTFYTYRAYVRMYAGMLKDMAETDSYINKLINKRNLSEFDCELRKMIETTLNG